MNPSTRVMKFGGTSVGDARLMGLTADIIVREASQTRLLIVVSAMQRVTESLLLAASAASRGETDAWRLIGGELADRHREVCDDQVLASERTQIQSQIDAELATLDDLCSGFTLVRELTPRSLDSLASLGEVISATLLAACLRARGRNAVAVDATRLIVTDDGFGNASPIFEPTQKRVHEVLDPMLAEGAIPVITGFRGATIDGACTTLGRDGSDYSATILGAVLPADEIWIWTDVAGVMTADPKLVPEARVISELSYPEAIELSFFGAKVLHPKALDLPSRADIPVRIKDTFHSDRAGTEIAGASPRRPGVRAIASTKEAVLFTISADRAQPFAQLATLVWGWLDSDRISTLLMVQSSAENVLCFAVTRLDAIRVRRRLERDHGPLLARAEELAGMGVVVAVGSGMKGTPGLAARTFGAVAGLGINVAAIAQGSSELTISLVVRSEEVEAAVQALHAEFEL